MCAAVIAAGQAHAQEISCRRFFMNTSAKRICATPELMQLDQKMGELARRVELHQNGFMSDQRQFRKSLKKCDGDVPCLMKSYEARINELQAIESSLPPPSADETIKLGEEAEKAEKKRDAQGGARAMWAQRLPEGDVTPEPTQGPVQTPITEVPPTAMRSGGANDISSAQPAQVSWPNNEVIETKSAEAPAVDESAAAQTTATTLPDQSAASGDDDSWILPAVLGVAALMVIAWIRSGLHRLFRVCPRCKKWRAGIVVDRNQSSYTDYEMRTLTDEHRNSHGVRTGSTVKQRQVAVRVTNTTDTLECRVCEHVWKTSSQHRS
jgi:hypothetical protein